MQDIGVGSGLCDQQRYLAVFELACKTSATDALKRTLRHFGDVLGNCLYNKTYIDYVSKLPKRKVSIGCVFIVYLFNDSILMISYRQKKPILMIYTKVHQNVLE